MDYEEDNNVYQTEARVGISGQEEFQIVRDRDWTQAIYPAVARCFKTSVPIRGPDALGYNKHWVTKGPPGAKILLKLKVKDGGIELTQNVENKGSKKWKSSDRDHWHDFYISGTWNDWGFSLMKPDPSGMRFRHRMTMGRVQDFIEEFR